MGYMEDKERRIRVFEDTIQFCESEQPLVQAIFTTHNNTRIYKEPLKELERPVTLNRDCQITVSTRRTLEAAYQLGMEYPSSRIGVLNFASATNPGGGVVRGSNAQEECLCRCTTLYPCLNVDMLWREYYSIHRQAHSALYTNACIYTPGIIGIKSDEKWPELLPQEKWLTLDVISCAAPNLRVKPSNAMQASVRDKVDIADAELKELLKIRIKGILQVAASCGIDVLVLGAFGCGAFCNPPELMASAFKEALEEYRFCFHIVEFAIYCNSHDTRNYDAFFRILMPECNRHNP